MSKQVSDQLFRLIKTLTATEKRYFKLFASRHTIGEKNDYVNLFDAIDRQVEYDEKALKKVLDKDKDTFTNSPAIAKSRLYETILKSLDAYHADSSIDVEIRKLLHYSEILFKKSLYDESNKVLLKAKKLAHNHEKYPALLDILKWEKKLSETNAYEGVSNLSLSELLKEDQQVIEKITNFSEFWYIKSRLFVILNQKGKVRDSQQLSDFKKIIDSTLLKSEDKALSYESRYLYYLIYSAYFFGIGDYKNSYKYIKKHLELIEANENLFGEEPNKYFAVLSNMVYLCTQLKKFDEVLIYLGKIKAIPEKLGRSMSEDLEIKLFSSSYSAELSLLIQTGEFEKAALLIPAIEKGLKKYKQKITRVRSTYFFFNIAIVYFALGNFSAALKSIHQLINDSELDTSEYLHCISRIFNLIIHLEMGNDDVLPYTLKSTLRYLAKRKRIYRFETVFLNFINKYSKAKNKEQQNTAYTNLYDELQILSKDPFEKAVFEYFDFKTWNESKIKRILFTEAVARKNEKEKQVLPV